MPSVHGEQPRPRLLLLVSDIDELIQADAVREAFARAAPTIGVISSLEDVDQLEWDVLVCTAGTPLQNVEPHLAIVTFGERGSGLVPYTGGGGFTAHYGNSTRARELEVPDGLPKRVAELVERDLIPTAQGQDANQVIVTVSPSTVVEPFLSTKNRPLALAGRALRPEGEAECWMLPSYANQVAWTEAAVREWEVRAPDRFPPRSPWQQRDAWLTVEERAATEKIVALKVERDALVARIDDQLANAREELAAASEAAAGGLRRLLTAQGDDLVAAVEAVLTDLGFAVTNMDKQREHASDRLEDLQVSTGATGMVLVEVRGYARSGGKTSDLTRMQRFAHRFEKANGSPPAACWYIINHTLETDPDERGEALAASQEDVEVFVEELNGVVIETTLLFKLAVRVARGALKAQDVRMMLVSARGHLSDLDGENQ